MPAESETLTAELQDLLDASPDAVLVVDRTGTVVALNRRTESLFAITADQLRGRPVETLLPERLRHAHRAARAGYSRAPAVRAMSTRRGLMGLRGDGTEFPVEISLTPVVGSSGLVMAVVHDVAARPTLEQALAPSDRTTATLDAIPDAIFLTDSHGRVDFLNLAAERLTGWTREAARKRTVTEILPLAGEAGEECLRSGTPGTCEAVLPAGPGRESRVLDISTTAVHDASGAVSGCAVLARDVTQAHRIARQLSHQATHDALTGLVNRAEFERRLQRVIEGAGGDRTENALCFLDLDGFKRVNDTCGHLAGDQLLRQRSDLMRDRMRSRDTLARLGGDEFGMLLEHCPLPEAARIAEEIRAAIGAHEFAFGGQTYTVGASIGIARITRQERVEDLLRAADGACYLAKRHGGNRIQLYHRRQSRSRGTRNVDWVRRLRTAIREERWLLYAQVLLPLEGGQTRNPRLEVLLRLDEGKGEPLLPDAFLPVANRHGLMPGIDRWVIRSVVGRLSEWCRQHGGAEPPVLAINLGEETVSGGKAGELVRQALGGSGVRPESLCFEIAESVATSHTVTSERLARELRATGCRVTLEHCGSAMAAFTLLRRLEVDFLKIAGSVVRNIAQDPIDRILAGAFVEVGRELGIRTIGAETESQETLACLRQIGVDYAQGYGVGRPEPLDAALARLA